MSVSSSIVRFVSIGLLLLGLASAAPADQEKPGKQVLSSKIALDLGRLSEKEIQRRLLASTGWVVTPDLGGKFGSGTCEVIDIQRRLAITNHHVTDNNKTMFIVFPSFVEGKLVKNPREAVQNLREIKAKVLASDPTRDLALLELESLPEGVEALPLAHESAQPKSAIHSLGNSGVKQDSLWTFRKHTVAAVSEVEFDCQAEGKVQHVKGRFVKITDVLCAQGDSGGPMVNERCELTAVVQSGNPGNYMHAVDVSEVKEFVAATLAKLAEQEEAGEQEEPASVGAGLLEGVKE